MGIIKRIQVVGDLPINTVLKKGRGHSLGESPVRLAGGMILLNNKGEKELVLPKKKILGKDVPISRVAF